MRPPTSWNLTLKYNEQRAALALLKMVQMYTTTKQNAMTDMDFNICMEATLRKVKTSKNKYFVLHGDTESSPAKLEYYNSKKHWDNRLKPRKIIFMKTCFSINAYSDSRVKYGLTVFTNEESMQIGFDNENERNNWLLTMRSLSDSNLNTSLGTNVNTPLGATASEHNWNVSVCSRKMRYPIDGMFQLRLCDRQTTLVRQEDPYIKIVLPFEVIREYGHKDSEFILDVGRQADTGPGQIWMTLGDPHTARNVYDIFNQSMNTLSIKPVEGFRPASKSLSYDRRSAYRRQYPNSMDKPCGRLHTQVAGQVSPFASGMSTSLSRLQRDRSDSVSSQSTSASVSIEELSSSGTNNGSSRCVTPDPRSDSANSYVPLSGDCTDNSSKHSTSSLNSDSGYTDMSLAKEDSNSNFMYIDMTIGAKSDTHGYVDMSCKPNNLKCNLKPLKVTSFVVCEESPTKVIDSSPSTVSNTAVSNRTAQYVPMCRKNGNRNSSPICHSDFFCQSNLKSSHNTSDTEDLFAALDDRNRAKSFTSSHRPRQSSWSQFLRPRSSSHGQKVGSAAISTDFQHRPNYVDMSQDSAAYVEMHPSSTHKDKENKYPHNKFSQRLSIAEPFAELSASDDDISLQSHEDSSVKSNTSLDNMSMNSQQSSVYCSSLDSEPYVTVNPPNALKTKTVKPVRVASFIVDDSSTTATKISPCSCTLSKVPK